MINFTTGVTADRWDLMRPTHCSKSGKKKECPASPILAALAGGKKEHLVVGESAGSRRWLQQQFSLHECYWISVDTFIF